MSTTAIAPVPRRIWAALLGAPAAWIVQGLAGWLIGARICAGASVAAVRVTLIGIGAAALVVSAGSLATGVTNWRTVNARGPSLHDRAAFLAFAGLFASGAFTVGIVWATLNALFIDVCGGMR
jgi:hypothetical protein